MSIIKYSGARNNAIPPASKIAKYVSVFIPSYIGSPEWFVKSNSTVFSGCLNILISTSPKFPPRALKELCKYSLPGVAKLGIMTFITSKK